MTILHTFSTSMLVRRLGCSSSFPRRQLLAPWPLVRKMASGTLPVIVLSSSSDSEGGEGEEKRQTARKRKIDDGDGDASRPPRPRPPPAAAAAASASVPSPPPATIATPLSFDRCDPLVSCGFALTATPNLERESGHEECNATVDRGARLADLVSSCSGSSLKSALVSNFMVDPVWLFTTLPALRNVEGHLAIVMGDDRMVEATRQSLLVFASKKALSSTVTRPPTEAFGTHHSKFFVLEYGWGVCVIVVSERREFWSEREREREEREKSKKTPKNSHFPFLFLPLSQGHGQLHPARVRLQDAGPLVPEVPLEGRREPGELRLRGSALRLHFETKTLLCRRFLGPARLAPPLRLLLRPRGPDHERSGKPQGRGELQALRHGEARVAALAGERVQRFAGE